VLYGAAKKGLVEIIERLQKKIVRNVKGVRSRAHTNDIFIELKILKFRDLVEYNKNILGHGVCYKTLPENFRLDFEPLITKGRVTRAASNMNLKIPLSSKCIFETAPCFTVPTAWNSLSTDLKVIFKRNSFKGKLRLNYFDKYRSEPECSRDGCYSCARTSRRP